MALNYKAVANVLKEKGWEDLKPFITDSLTTEVWGYKTKDSTKTIFHFCDSDFKDLDRESAQISVDPLFLLETPDYYSICPEGFSVLDYNNNNQDSATGKAACWLVSLENEILDSIYGYVKLCGDFYLLRSSLFEIEQHISDHNTWKPGGSYSAYNVNERLYQHCNYEGEECKNITYEYLGTYRNYHFMRKYENDRYKYFVVDAESNSIFEGYPTLWKRSDCDLCLVSVSGDENKWTLNFYDGSIKTVVLNSLFKFGYGDSEEYYADDNIIVIKLKHYEDYFGDENLYSFYLLVINKEGEVLYYGENNLKGSINRILNGYIITYGSRGKSMVFDSSTRILADNIDLKDPYFVFSGGKGFCPSPDKKDEYPLLGAMRTNDISIIVPAVYECIDIVEFEPVFVAIVGNRQYENGISVMKYGLYVNGIMKKPVNTEIRRLREKKDHREEYIVWKKDEKYGLLYQGEECLPPNFDDISWGDDCIKLSDDDYVGVYSKKLNFLSEIKYYDVKLLEEEKIMIADNNLYFIKDGIANLLIESDRFMEYLASEGHYHMFRDDKEDFGYKCFFISSNGKVETIELSECKDYYDIETCDDDGIPYNERHYLDFEPGSYICVYEGSLYFDTDDNCFYHYYEIRKTYHEEDQCEEASDDYDYERDTYYALGGEDYDRFKEEGGSIDAMMDGMGY